MHNNIELQGFSFSATRFAVDGLSKKIITVDWIPSQTGNHRETGILQDLFKRHNEIALSDIKTN